MANELDDYERLKGFVGRCFDRLIARSGDIDPDAHPLAVLAKMESTAPRRARQGLTMAINDCLERSAGLSPAEVRAFDADLASQGLPTLSELRLRFWRRIHAVLKRGRIRSEVEYYAIKNAADVAQADEERARLWALIEDYERRAGGTRPTA